MLINCHSYYSFKYGALSPTELVEEMQTKGYISIALTDINSTSGSLYFAMEAQKKGLAYTLGIDFRKDNEQYFIAIAQSNMGFQTMNLYLSSILDKSIKLEKGAPVLDECFIIYPLKSAPETLKENEFIGITFQQLVQYNLKHKTTWPAEKCVALHPASFRHKRDFNTHRLLRAINCNALLSKLSLNQQGKETDLFYPKEELETLFQTQTHLIDNSKKLLSNCAIHFDFDGTRQNRETFSGDKQKDKERLRELSEQGLAFRFKTTTPTILERVNMELRVIEQCNFVPYFLINHTIVSYARSKGYFYVGRGSGSNSLIAYLLRITNVDPIELDLYFERFINPSRKSPPDFDIDFSWTDRNDVTRFMFESFGNVALMGSFVTFQKRSVIREIGKVLGLSSDEIKNIQRTKNPNELDSIAKLCLRYSHYIHGFPDHLSIHSSGIIITEKPIQYFGACSMPPKGFPTAHFDMHIAEDIGIHKYDILGQRGLAKIKDAIAIVKQNQPNAPAFDIDDIAEFKKDENIKQLLRTGDTIGCFYVESPAMRGLMKKLEVDEYKGLVAASSIIRPGVSQSGMMQEFIKRHREPTARAASHPVLGEILNETYGVMVYQEDVLKVAHYFAGLTLEESDMLRRGMSWKFRERVEFSTVKNKFYDNCNQKGYAPQLIDEIWTQIESFANYAFAKGHSASYAVESYQSLFLKAYYPIEYMVATINNFGGFYHTEQYIQEAKLKGATVETPCINTSEQITVLQGKTIYLGFQHMKELESKVIHRFLYERTKNGLFTDLEEFIYRVAISLEMMIILIRIGAFQFTGKSKNWLLWKAHFLLATEDKTVAHPKLFDYYNNTKKVTIPTLESMPYENVYDELEYLGFLISSPFELIEDEYLQYRTVYSDFAPNIGKPVIMIGYLVHTKRTQTRDKKVQDMSFGTFMDRAGYFFDTVHFPNVYNAFSFKGKGCYLLKGRVSSHYDYLSLEVSAMKKVPYDKIGVEG